MKRARLSLTWDEVCCLKRALLEDRAQLEKFIALPSTGETTRRLCRDQIASIDALLPRVSAAMERC